MQNLMQSNLLLIICKVLGSLKACSKWQRRLWANPDYLATLATIHQLGIHDALAPYSIRLADLSIDEMNLTARSSNSLKHTNTGTFGRLRDLLAMENGILFVRKLGQQSAKDNKPLFLKNVIHDSFPMRKRSTGSGYLTKAECNSLKLSLAVQLSPWYNKCEQW